MSKDKVISCDDERVERYEATVSVDIEIKAGTVEWDSLKQIALERLHDELESEAINVTPLE
jgi:hypothetical protein